jgi:hypothetical protein
MNFNPSVVSFSVSVGIVIMAVIAIKIIAMSTQRRYFVSYVTQKHHQPAIHQNCIIDQCPISWQLKQNKTSNGVRYRVVSWQIVNKKQASVFQDVQKGNSHNG